MFEFNWPWMILLLIVPYLVRMVQPPKLDSEGTKAPEISFPYLDRLKTAFPPRIATAPQGNKFYTFLLWSTWVFLTGALMQPQFVDTLTETKTEGHDIMLLVDLSGSMHALDFQMNHQRVNRLMIIKDVVGNFIQERQGDRMGLVLFGTNAYLQAPLTSDTVAVGQMLDNSEIGEAGDSTAIGDALGVAVRNLRDRPGHSKIIILLTDGADNASTIPPLQSARLAKQYGIRVYTIGVGSNGPVPMPDQFGNIVLAQMDLDEDLLREIATMTGGSYFRAADTEVLQKAYDEIDALERTEDEARSYMVRTPLYRIPLGIALACTLGLALLPVGRRFAS